MLTENQFGVVFDVIHFPPETKKKIIALRNMKIREGQENFTCTDAIVYAINCGYELEKAMAGKKQSNVTVGANNASEVIRTDRPDLSNRIKTGEVKNGNS